MKPHQDTQQPQAARKSVPREIVWAACSLFAVGLIHWLDIVLIATHRQEAVPSAMTQYLLNSSIVVHVIFGTLFILCAWLIRTGRNWLRLCVTVLLAIELLAHLSLPTIIALLPGEAIATIIVQAISLLFELAALFLLWFPRPTRLFFTVRKGDMQHTS